MTIKNSKVYDTLKYIARYVLPALTTLYVGLSEVWHFPYTVEVSATLTAVITFINILLGISNENYAKEKGNE